MKKYLLIVLFFSCLNSSKAQTGLPDPSFGINGIVTTNLGSAFNYSNVGKQVLLQSNGSIYFILEAAGVTVIAKKLGDGSPDISYGNNGLSVSVPVYGSHAAMQADGKIVIAGYTLNYDQYTNVTDFAVARYNTDGSLDNTFDGDGIQTTDFRHGDVANSLSIQSDGKIVVAGYTDEYYSGDVYMSIARYNQDGSPDNTFDGDGKLEAMNEFVNSVAIQSDGKIVVGNGNALARFESNGVLDASFYGGDFYATSPDNRPGSIAIQSDGKILMTYGFGVNRFNSDGSPDIAFDIAFAGSENIATSIAIQTDGKVILAGYTTDVTINHFAIARYNTDGSLDNAFSGDGMQTSSFGSSKDYANAIAIQSDGKLVALGYTINGSNTWVAAARYNTDGSPDNSFDGDGELTDHINQGSTYYTSTAIQSDGKVLAAGYTWNGNNYDFAVARYNTDGSLDNTFSGDGKQITDFSSTDDKARDIAIQTDGKILVAGSASDNFGLIRYNTDGSFDNTFNGSGKQTTDFGSTDSATSIAIQSDGKIVVGGSALARYNTNGTLDISFDEDGKLTRPFAVFNSTSPFNCNDIAIQNDGKIIIAGRVAYNMCIVARYNSDGSTDSTFGDNTADVYGAKLIIDFDNPNYTEDVFFHGKSLAIQTDGKIVIGGDYEHNYKGTSSSFALARLNSNGSLDNTFDGDGLVFTFAGYLNYGTSVKIQSDNKIILGGYCYNGSSDNFTIARYNADGILDNTFSEDGVEITKASGAYSRIAGIAIAGNNLYAAGYGQYPGNFGVVVKYLLAAEGQLPVTLADFTATLQSRSVLLQWQTISEHNLSSFIIERSADGNTFYTIGNVPAAGNSNSKINYSTFDQQPLHGVNFYRLKMADTDGKFTYSKIVTVNVNDDLFTFRVFPNPAKNVLFVGSNGVNEKATFNIIDGGGRKLKEVKVALNGNTLFSVNLNGLPKGTYYLQINTTTKIEARKFIKE